MAATGSLHVGVAGVAKKAAGGQPFAVANELICDNLARAILLPVPPGFIIEEAGDPWFVSLNFNLAGEDLPPVNAGALASAQPKLACGIVLFDIWLVNSDRHHRNLAFDQSTNRVQVFDHGHAFYHTANGRQYLEERQDRLGVGNHCLIAELTSLADMDDWFNRINSIPEYYINEIIQAGVAVGLPSGDQAFCVDYLLTRRQRLRELIHKQVRRFRNVQPLLM